MKHQRKTIGLLCSLLLLWSMLAPASVADVPPIANVLWVDDDYHPGTPGWNVTHFATLSDGLAAVAEGGHINVLPGLYQGPFVIATRGVKLQGLGPVADIVLHGNSAPSTVYVSAEDVSIKRLTITGGGIQGLRLAGANGTRISHCVIRGNASVGIRLESGWDYTIAHNQIADNQDTGVALGVHLIGEVGNSVIQDNQIMRHHNPLQQGGAILVENGGRGIEINGNTIAETDYGIRVTNSSHVTIADNDVSLCRHSGIHVQDANQVTVRQNRSTRNQGSGIMLVGTRANALPGETIVDGNFCQANDAAGIYARHADHLLLTGNICAENGLHGMALESSHITVTANRLLDNRYDGLRVYAADPVTGAPLSDITIHGNSLLGNQRYGLCSQAAAPLDARGNWWGRNTPQPETDIAGAVIYEPWMTLSLQADPNEVAIGGAASQIRAAIQGGGYTVADGTPIALQASAGRLEGAGPFLTEGGQVQTSLFSEDVAQSVTITATTASAVATTYIAFYHPDGSQPLEPVPSTNSGIIQGHVWVDANGNGAQEEGEPPLAGARVELRGSQDPANAAPLGMVVTSADGGYTLSGVPVGSYCLTLLPPPGYLAVERSQCIEVAKGDVLNIDWLTQQGYTLALPLVH
jgi:parallel beta-helix repeat protein